MEITLLSNGFRDEGYQCKVSRALDRLYQLALVSGARTCDAFRDNLPLFRDEPNKPLVVFIVDVDFLALAKAASPTFLNLLILFCHVVVSLCTLCMRL